MEAILTQTLTLFIMTALGFMAAKLGWLTKEVRSGLTNVLLNIATPCIVLRAFQYESSAEIWRGMMITFVVLGASMAAGVALGLALFRKRPPLKRAPLVFGMSFGNMGFMGIPVIGAFVGAEGLIYVSMAIVVFNILSWTLGVSLFSPDAFNPKKLLQFPCLYAVAVGLVMFSLRIPLPPVLDSAMEMAGSVNSPLAMMLLGAVIADSKLGAFLRDGGAMAATGMRLAFFPAVTLAVCAIFHIEGMLRTVLTLLSGMPAAVNTVLLSVMLGGDEDAASHVVGMSTLLYLPAVFCWMLVLGV